MQIEFTQTILAKVIDDDICEESKCKDIIEALYKKRISFSVTLRKDGFSKKYDSVRIFKINKDNSLDLVSIGSGHTLTLKSISINDILAVSIMLTDPVDLESSKHITIENILDL